METVIFIPRTIQVAMAFIWFYVDWFYQYQPGYFYYVLEQITNTHCPFTNTYITEWVHNLDSFTTWPAVSTVTIYFTLHASGWVESYKSDQGQLK